MASEPEGEGVSGHRPRRFLALLAGSGGSSEGDPSVFFPVVVGVVGSRGGEAQEPSEPSEPPASSPPAGHIVLVSPLTQEMVVLGRAGGGGGLDLAALVQEILAADGGYSRGPPPASRASIEAMRAVERPGAGGGGQEEEGECAVCLDGLWEGEAVKEMPCRHRFHGVCIEKWLGMHGSCPVCRYRMPEEERAGGKKEEREIWVSLGFSSTAAPDDGQQQQQQPMEELD